MCRKWGRGGSEHSCLPHAADRHYIAQIAAVETVAAITLRTRRGNNSPVDAAAAIADFRRDYQQEYLSLPVTASVIMDTMELAEQHGLRGYDAVHLAAALQLNLQCASLGLPSPIVISADNDLNTAAAAAAEGLVVDDP